jgi:hypothetical protein
MVCSSEIRAAVSTLVAPATAVGTATWRAPDFSCTYRLPGHVLVVEVREAGTAAGALADLRRRRRQALSPRTITGLASFGLPGFQSDDGEVVFAKDDKTLRVDARDLPARSGRFRQTRGQIAYQVASDILSCWNGG